MINKPPPFKILNIRIPIIIFITGRGFINQGSGLYEIIPGVYRLLASNCHTVWVYQMSQVK